MKLSRMEELKKICLEHKQKFVTKDRGPELKYKAYKKAILDRIVLIEDIKLKERKYLEDIQSYLDMLKTKHKVDLLPEIPADKPPKEKESETKTGSATTAPPTTGSPGKKERDKHDPERKPETKPIPESPGKPGVEGGGGKTPV